MGGGSGPDQSTIAFAFPHTPSPAPPPPPPPSLQLLPGEPAALMAALADRDAALRRGLVIGGVRYETHRHHPPLAWGRAATPGGDPAAEDGAGVAGVGGGGGAGAAAVWRMPAVSARMVPALQAFAGAVVGGGEG